jgi:asparagine synthase (glutamine-hydrolysing)
MCGIAGYFGTRQIPDSKVQETLGTMKNRGPDSQDFVRINGSSTQALLLHSRLSIIDLDSRANQPFKIGPYTLIYNGELYNYLEIRKQLQAEGVAFNTDSDTEVLLQAYIRHGEACLESFEGMWAFAIYDERDQSLLVSRDRFGEKPLYFARTSDGFYFASETRTLRTLCDKKFAPNQAHLLRYLVNGYKSLYKEKDTFYEGIEEIPYSTSLKISSRLKYDFKRYWQPEYRPDDRMTLQDAIEGARTRLLDSVKLRLRSDVPMAFCLSGGVDSATLASIAAKVFNHKVETFSIIEKDERYNEYDNIMATVNDIHCKPHLIELESQNALEALTGLVRYHDAPVGTTTYYTHFLLSRAISANGFRVAFSGTSADELFTGYYDHFNLHLYEMRNHPDYARYSGDWMQHTGRFVRNPYLKKPDLYFRDQSIRDHIYLDREDFIGYLKVPFTENFKEEAFCGSLLRNRMLNELFHESTPLILHEDDLNSMLYSVENRSPFLDRGLFDFCYSIPNPHLIRDGYGKYVLREAMKGILNDAVRLDRRKKGFNASVYSFIDLDDSATWNTLTDPKAAVFDLVDRDKMMALLKERPMDNSFSKFIFNFINLRIFLD